MHTLSLRELADGLAKAQFSSEELTRHFLARIAAHNPALNAYITVLEEQSLAAARAGHTLPRSSDAVSAPQSRREDHGSLSSA